MRKKQHQTARFEGEVLVNGAKGLFYGDINCLFEAQQISCLKRYIVKYVKNPADVDGRIQDTLLEAFQAYPDFKGDSSLKTWLISIAKHQIAHYYRQAANATNHLHYHENIASNNQTRDDEEYQAARNEELLERVLSLPREYQQILYWHAMEGLSHAEIGKKLGISEDAVNMRISRARATLKHIVRKKVK